jgi:5,10-methylenetetrahydromethanopterin reductase
VTACVRLAAEQLTPGEAELIDEQLIRDTRLLGKADELIERIRALVRDGLQKMIFAVSNETNWRLADEFSGR